jgi:hypothetical protein
MQVAVMSGLGITYTVTGGSSLASLARRHGYLGVHKTGCIVAFSAAQVLLSQVGAVVVVVPVIVIVQLHLDDRCHMLIDTMVPVMDAVVVRMKVIVCRAVGQQAKLGHGILCSAGAAVTDGCGIK